MTMSRFERFVSDHNAEVYAERLIAKASEYLKENVIDFLSYFTSKEIIHSFMMPSEARLPGVSEKREVDVHAEDQGCYYIAFRKEFNKSRWKRQRTREVLLLENSLDSALTIGGSAEPRTEDGHYHYQWERINLNACPTLRKISEEFEGKKSEVEQREVGYKIGSILTDFLFPDQLVEHNIQPDGSLTITPVEDKNR